ncbi:hypothetical protein [Pseudocolwellia sp. HL-MZ7]|uniref:hypothetical protein n=1 Tax=Pseudocolwellia sp. HL-MZ7 TaxID=3400627 RepID=UPI003CF68DD0
MDINDFTDERELVSSIIEGTFDEEINLPESKVERLTTDEVIELLKEVLELIYSDEFGSRLFGANNRGNRNVVKQNLLRIFEISLGRDLLDGESKVFNSAIEIFFHLIQGKSFREIVGIRYNQISNRGGNPNQPANFTQPANKLPDSTLSNMFPLFKDTKSKDVSYDAVVFDTYDYLDTVISFSLSDVFMGAFSIYHNVTRDSKAIRMIELLKYGTNDSVHTLLIRYGFPPDEVSEISEYIEHISEESISFKSDIFKSSTHIQELVQWYLP